jgi:hypothetical protein
MRQKFFFTCAAVQVAPNINQSLLLKYYPGWLTTVGFYFFKRGSRPALRPYSARGQVP